MTVCTPATELFLRGAQPPLESMLRLNDALSDGEPLSLCETLTRITREVNGVLESSCDVFERKMCVDVRG